MTTTDLKYGGDCQPYRKLMKIPDTLECCSSCHWDLMEGYEACEETIGNKYYTVCCTVANYEVKEAVK